jgi:hypothetical protein
MTGIDTALCQKSVGKTAILSRCGRMGLNPDQPEPVCRKSGDRSVGSGSHPSVTRLPDWWVRSRSDCITVVSVSGSCIAWIEPHSLPKSIRSPPSTRAGGNAKGKPGQRSEEGMALGCSVRCRRSLLPKSGQGLPVVNESDVKARFARSW